MHTERLQTLNKLITIKAAIKQTQPWIDNLLCLHEQTLNEQDHISTNTHRQHTKNQPVLTINSTHRQELETTSTTFRITIRMNPQTSNPPIIWLIRRIKRQRNLAIA